MVEGCLPSLGTPALCRAPVALLPALLPARWGLLGLCCIVCSPGSLPSSRVLTPLCVRFLCLGKSDCSPLVWLRGLRCHSTGPWSASAPSSTAFRSLLAHWSWCLGTHQGAVSQLFPPASLFPFCLSWCSSPGDSLLVSACQAAAGQHRFPVVQHWGLPCTSAFCLCVPSWKTALWQQMSISLSAGMANSGLASWGEGVSRAIVVQRRRLRNCPICSIAG